MMQRDFGLERRAGRIALLTLVPGAICLIVGYGPWAVPTAWKMAILGIGVILIWTALIAWSWRTARTATDAHGHQFIICPACRYDLKGLSESGHCPECGRPYAHEELARTWKKQLGMPEIDPKDELRMILDTSASDNDKGGLKP